MPAKICEKKSPTSRAQALEEGGTERNPFVERKRGIEVRARARLCDARVPRRGNETSVPKGSGGRSDGGTVVVVAEQRGVYVGIYDLGPRTRRAPGGEGESVPRI